MNTLSSIRRILGYSVILLIVSPLLPVVGLAHLIARLEEGGEISRAQAKASGKNSTSSTNYFVNPPSCDSLSFPMAN